VIRRAIAFEITTLMMMSVNIIETTKTMRIGLVVSQIQDPSNDFRNFKASHMHPGVTAGYRDRLGTFGFGVGYIGCN